MNRAIIAWLLLGGGKAAQYFLRGFDADHGTDVAFFLDGIPVNFRSHAHGQGYTDLHFMIPETLKQVDVFKGPYWVEYGDFATAAAGSWGTRGEPVQGVNDINYTPGNPRTVMGGLALRF